LTLQPPTELGWEYVWSYVRGYFDGDGHATKDGKGVQITCGSLPFITWVILDLFRSHHKIYEHPKYERADGTSAPTYGCYVSEKTRLKYREKKVAAAQKEPLG
jgi:hypothetical protein